MTTEKKPRNKRLPNGSRRVQIPVSLESAQADRLNEIAAESGTTVSLLLQDSVIKSFRLNKLEKKGSKKK